MRVVIETSDDGLHDRRDVPARNVEGGARTGKGESFLMPATPTIWVRQNRIGEPTPIVRRKLTR